MTVGYLRRTDSMNLCVYLTSSRKVNKHFVQFGDSCASDGSFNCNALEKNNISPPFTPKKFQ